MGGALRRCTKGSVATNGYLVKILLTEAFAALLGLIMPFTFVLYAILIANAELFIRWNHFQQSDPLVWGFGQVWLFCVLIKECV